LAEEILDETLGLGVIQQAFDLLVKRFGVAKFSTRSERDQRIVGRGIPQEVGEAGGQRVLVESAGLASM